MKVMFVRVLEHKDKNHEAEPPKNSKRLLKFIDLPFRPLVGDQVHGHGFQYGFTFGTVSFSLARFVPGVGPRSLLEELLFEVKEEKPLVYYTKREYEKAVKYFLEEDGQEEGLSAELKWVDGGTDI